MNQKITEAAKTIHSLTSMPVFCYKNGQLEEYYSVYRIPDEIPDLFLPYRDSLKDFESSIGCITTMYKFYFGFIRYNNEYMVIGPFTDSPKSFDELTKIADRLDPAQRCHNNIIDALHKCPQRSVASFFPILSNTYRMLSFHEDGDLCKNEDFLNSVVEVAFHDTGAEGLTHHNLSMESFFEGMIERGDVEGMEEWFRDNPIFHFRMTITGDELRDARDCFILCSSLYAKAAYRGGLDRGFTLRLQLNAIRAMEELDSINDILVLQSKLALEYTREVALQQETTAHTKLVRDAIRIIQRKMFETIRIDEIAKELSVSRGYLSKAFHAETGQTISEYAMERKIAEAKRQLRSSHQSLSSISETLRFSSQSHFTKVFKRVTGMTPKQFRDFSNTPD